MDPPRPAATVVVARPAAGADAFEVFLVKRHGRAGFLAGAHVFPGGRVDEEDRALAERLPPEIAVRARSLIDDGQAPAEALAFAVAAVRETVEECGLLLARDEAGAPVSARVAEEVFAALHEGASFAAEIKRRRLVLDLERLSLLAWWITPEAEPKRFDTRFFLAEAPPAQRARADRKETTEGEWLSPRAALRAYAEGRIRLAPPTLATLEDLADDGDLDTARAKVPRPLRPICPKLIDEGDGLVLALPGDPLHDEREPALPRARTRIVLLSEGRFSSARGEGPPCEDGLGPLEREHKAHHR